MSHVPLSAWLKDLLAAANDFVVNSLEWSPGEMIAQGETLPENMVTSCIGLVGEGGTLQLGISLRQEHAHEIVCAMLGIPRAEGPPAPEDIADALGEFTNVTGGRFKVRVSGPVSNLVLALPIVLNGKIEIPGDTEVAVGMARWRDIEGHLFLMRKRIG